MYGILSAYDKINFAFVSWTLFKHTSSVVGAATLTPKQRLRIAGMTLLVELQHKISRHVAVYFSIVRRKECWASFVSLSTSVNTTTINNEKKRGGITVYICKDFFELRVVN